MNVLSLFNGMSCGMLALLKAGKKVDNYFSSEIDKHAIKASKTKFPSIIHLGSVVDVDAKNLPIIDLLIAGSPCQGFSNAGKGLNFNDPRSALFFEFVRLLKQCRERNPKLLFLLENVRMKKEWEDIISRILEIQPILINSALVSAQNRERLYWTNIAAEKQGLFGDMVCTIPQPEDRKIFLKDILQSPEEVDEKYYYNDLKIEKMLKHKHKHKQKVNGFGNIFLTEEDEKCNTILAKYPYSGTDSYIVNKELELKPNQQKSGCFTAGGNSGGNHSDMDLIVEPIKQGCIKFGRTEEAKEIRKKNMQRGKDYSPFSKKEIVDIDYEKMNTLVTQAGKDNLIFEEHPTVHNMQPRSGDPKKGGTGRLSRKDGKTYCLDTGNTNAVEVPVTVTDNYIQLEGVGYEQDNRIYFEEGKSPTITLKASVQKDLLNTCRIRRLTPIEVCRLQTVPDDFFLYPIGYVPSNGKKKAKNDDGSIDEDDTYNPGKNAGSPIMFNGELRYQIVSDSQIYKMCGNGWNVDTIAHIFSFIP